MYPRGTRVQRLGRFRFPRGSSSQWSITRTFTNQPTILNTPSTFETLFYFYTRAYNRRKILGQQRRNCLFVLWSLLLIIHTVDFCSPVCDRQLKVFHVQYEPLQMPTYACSTGEKWAPGTQVSLYLSDGYTHCKKRPL